MQAAIPAKAPQTTIGLVMPIYAYKCDDCGHQKDVLQKISDPVLTDCPACGKATFKKQLTAAGFQLKGGGWYVTDFRNGSAAAASTSSKPDNANIDANAGNAGNASTDSNAISAASGAASAPASSSPPASSPASN
jgi:putative FmdB family regulatory protein